MKLNITPGPWTYTMPKEGKSKAKISGENWTFFANVHVRVDNKDSKEGESNLTAIVTAVNNTYHKGINPEAVPEMLEVAKEVREWYEKNQKRYFGEDTPVCFSKLLSAIQKAKL